MAAMAGASAVVANRVLRSPVVIGRQPMSRSAWPEFLIASRALLWVAARRPAARARLREREQFDHPFGATRSHDGLVLEIVVQVIHLPLHAVGIRDPELVLVGVAAIDAHLLAHRQSR